MAALTGRRAIAVLKARAPLLFSSIMPASPSASFSACTKRQNGGGQDDVLRDVEKELGAFSLSPMLPEAPGMVLVISGPSGVGKDSVVEELGKRRSDVDFVVTATTRAKRPGERDGVDYVFMTKEKFEDMIANDLLLEHSLVYGDYKGIPRKHVDDCVAKGKNVVLRIDVQGAATVKKLMPNSVSIFLTAESEAALFNRLARRKTEDKDKLLIRIATAQKELAHLESFDYAVVNEEGKMDTTVSMLSSIIDAERMKIARRLQLPMG